MSEHSFDDVPPCDGHFHQWRILSAEEVAERYPGELRGVAVAKIRRFR